MAHAEKYWFNTKTRRVEKGLKSSSLNRIGPFETPEEAANAEQLVKERSKKWLEEEQKDQESN